MLNKASRRRFASAAGAFALRRLQASLERKSPDEAEAAGRKWGRWIHRIAGRRRERCLANLEMIFPEMDKTTREDLCIKVFEHYGMVTADFLRARLRTREDILSTTHVEGKELLDAALAQGRGIILITGHFGNWERLSAWVGASGYPLSVVARDTADGGLNSLLAELRSTTGTKVIPRGNAARPIIEALRRNELVGILPDQNSDEVFIPFLGKPAGTVLGPGVIADRTQAPVMCMWCVRTGPNQYRMWIEPPLEPAEGTVKGEGMMRAIHASLERVIREYPEQWLWFHDRWRNARKVGLIADGEAQS